MRILQACPSGHSRDLVKSPSPPPASNRLLRPAALAVRRPAPAVRVHPANGLHEASQSAAQRAQHARQLAGLPGVHAQAAAAAHHLPGLQVGIGIGNSMGAVVLRAWWLRSSGRGCSISYNLPGNQVRGARYWYQSRCTNYRRHAHPLLTASHILKLPRSRCPTEIFGAVPWWLCDAPCCWLPRGLHVLIHTVLATPPPPAGCRAACTSSSTPYCWPSAFIRHEFDAASVHPPPAGCRVACTSSSTPPS